VLGRFDAADDDQVALVLDAADTDRVQGMGTCKALVPRWDDAPGVEV
jgi:hypothetical protein